MKRMKRLYVQFQQANEANHNSAINGGGAIGRGGEGKLGNASNSPSSSLAPSTSSPDSSQSGSPTSRRWRAVGPVGGFVGASPVAPAKSLLSIPTYLSAELSKSPAACRVQPDSKRFAVSTNAPPVPDEKHLIASLKLGYLQRLAAGFTDNSAATVHSNDKHPVAAAAAAVAKTDENTALGNQQMFKANTSHELVDYAQHVVRQQKQKRRMKFKHQQEQQRQQQQQQQQQQCEEEDESRQFSFVLHLPQLPQQPSNQQQLHQASRPRLNTASQTVRRQLFPVDRRYFMQHTRGSFSTAMQIELWDSCPEFGRLPPSNWHNQVSRPPPRSKVSMLSKLKRSVLDSKSFKDTKFLFTSWNYLSFLASNFLLYFWYDITYTFMPDHAKEIGLSDNEVSLIIALIGVSNTIGQIVIGYIGDFPRVNTVLLYALCMSLTGVANFLVPWCHSLASLLVYGILYGFLVSANYALCSIVIIDLFGIDRLTTGYGLMMFFQGFANLVGPPAMGHMRDSDSNYDRAFIYSGIFVLVSNLLILSIYPAIYRWARDCCCHGNKAAAGNPATSRKKTPPSLEEAAEEAAEPLTSA
ncbi:hypothetical protein BOX15_Mlig029100g2 [Macrostomum lignano]|uniref:Major facilitator superfamily (MFS) profile domain-containing protein n=1 Tax=Macrostomum lignano TaxID=282301 RepID=A0A267ECZ0_9PLAT|nr:hypothetical protein BOX15_Mlig029100g2 [Macrostomum lignano]